MKKLLLFIILFFSTSILLAQNFNQPTQFNQMCDENNDGFASFWLGEISFEILGNLNPQDYAITHHETQMDATVGANALSSPYFNINAWSQTVFVRIVTVANSNVTILSYDLNVNPLPDAPTVTLTNCTGGIPPCWNLTTAIPQIVMGDPSLTVSFYFNEPTAAAGVNAILNTDCYINPLMLPIEPPVFYRVTNPITGCFSIGTVLLVTTDCENPNCPAPTVFHIESATGDSITLDWAQSPGASSYMVTYGINGGPIMAVSTGLVSSVTIPDLLCDSVYMFSVSANCGNNGVSISSDWIYYETSNCPPQPGQPINLVVCGDNSNGCFDLNNNDSFILGNLNPSEYTITYHLSQADADNDAAAITNPGNFCAQHGQPIYARLENNANPTTFQTFTFALEVDTFSENVVQLNSMQQCDENNDTVVTFDLTAVQAQINSTNTLEYYPSLANAQNQVVPFINPSVLNLGVQNPITNVFVREIVPNGCDNMYTLQLFAYANCNLAYTCASANSLCNSLGVPFANTVNVNSTGEATCLATTPNPTWFYLPISNAGSISLQINQNTMGGTPLDVDYIVYGPFADPVAPCSNPSLLMNSVVSCSYSAAAVEYPIIQNAQPGQFYLLMVTNYSNQPGLITITETSSSIGAIDCSGLRLNAFLDANNNGTQDNGEQNFPLGHFTYQVNDNGNIHNIVSPTGVYNIYDNNASNSYDLSYTIDPNYVGSYGITTAAYSNINVIIGGGMQTYNFPITVTQAYNDLAVNIIPVNAPRPGFTYMNKIVYTNHGNQTVAVGTVTFNHDSLVSITANTQSGTTPITNGFTYNFTNLLPFESRQMTVTMLVPTIPTVTIGGLLTNTASIAPLAGDVVPLNNNISNTQVIIGSYDPNDKMEAHGGRILHSTFTSNDYLTYTIRFENSGTASAENVRVNDVLDYNLDETTIRMVSASHPYIMDRVGNNVNWIFDDIQLSPSVANTNIGKGYITFQVKPRTGYAIGDIIPNTASIYFDFNPAIITNTFNTEFVQQLGVGEFENADFVFYPNPVSDIVTIKVKNNGTIASIVVYDVAGKTVVAQKPANALSTQTLDLSSVSKGMYLLEVTTDTNSKVVKKLIVE